MFTNDRERVWIRRRVPRRRVVFVSLVSRSYFSVLPTWATFRGLQGGVGLALQTHVPSRLARRDEGGSVCVSTPGPPERGGRVQRGLRAEVWLLQLRSACSCSPPQAAPRSRSATGFSVWTAISEWPVVVSLEQLSMAMIRQPVTCASG